MPIAAHLPEIEPGLLLAWLATYLLHSTLLLGAAWGASRLLRGRALGVEEALWKAALVGGLVTAAVQVGVAGLGGPPPGEPVALVAEAASPAAPGPGTAALAPVRAVVADRDAAPAGAPPGARSAADPRLSTLAAVLPGWQRLLLASWLLGAAVLTSGLALSWLRLRTRLRGRREVTGGPVRHLLDRLLGRLGAPAGGDGRGGRRVRLTGSATLPVPVALGVGEREICRRRWLPAAGAALLLAGAAPVPGLAPSSFAVPQADEDHDHDHDVEVDHDFDYDHDFHFDHDFDFDFDLPDPGEISELIGEALEAQREALEELAELRFEEPLSAEERAELEAELRAANEEIERANEEIRRANEELRQANEELPERERREAAEEPPVR